MHDIRFIRENPQLFDAGLQRRGLAAQSAEILDLDARRRAAQTQAQEMLARRNQASKEIGQRKAKKEDAGDLMAEVNRLKEQIGAAEAQDRDLGAQLERRLAEIPNLPAADVPNGADETANKEVRRWGEPAKFDFAARDHADLGEALKLMDFERGAKLSGARFTVLSGQIARLHRALGQFMLDLQTREHGYSEIDPPLLVRDQTAYGTGNLPKFAEDLFQTTSGYWLIPTAEVSLTNLVAEEILDEATLPRRYTALTACFRAEAGAAGKDTRGMLRQHQFYKVELVSIAHPDKSNEEHERMTSCAEQVLKRLELPYRTVMLCTGDMGFAARKTYDIEVWLPGQNRYREISSCSNCGDFQARRMNARFRPTGGPSGGKGGTQFVHTLNGSGLAVGRTLIAVMENYQQKDGTIRVPEVLKPYMGGVEVIGASS
jgi:seryl-tRNA synthetase